MNISIVIADDHQLFIDGIKSILIKEIGISIVGEANNGLQLLQILESGIKPDIILTDIRMPIMNGISATRIISKKFPAIPILVLSMYDQLSDIQEMIDAGAKGYIAKNTDKKELIAAIHIISQGKRYIGAQLADIHVLQEGESYKRHPLSKREKQIVALVAKGRTSVQISHELNISKLTVDSHRKNIYKKLGIKNVAGLIRFGLEELPG